MISSDKSFLNWKAREPFDPLDDPEDEPTGANPLPPDEVPLPDRFEYEGPVNKKGDFVTEDPDPELEDPPLLEEGVLVFSASVLIFCLGPIQF